MHARLVRLDLTRNPNQTWESRDQPEQGEHGKRETQAALTVMAFRLPPPLQDFES
jgi:hypothetical protein